MIRQFRSSNFASIMRRFLTNKLWTLLLLTAFALGNVQISRADSYVESEPNNSFATGQVLTTGDGVISVIGFRESGAGLGYNDFFRFNAAAGNVITLRALPATIFDGDPVLALFNPAEAVVAENNDCEDSFGFDSCVRSFALTTGGLYGAGVRGFGNSTFDYTLTITGLTPTTAPIPEPATIMLLGSGLGGLAVRLVNRRRNRRAQTAARSNRSSSEVC